jgi:5-methylcytosine-specific restriction protein A
MPATGPKRLNWEWEELVLACDLVMQNNGRYIDDRDQRAVELSQVLGQMPLHPQEARLPDFRNPNGVAQKTRNLVQHFPGYTGSASRGSKKDGEVVEAFLADPEGMHELAESIRASVAGGNPLPPRPPEQRAQAVSLPDITREAVLKAIAEYDGLGQDAFLEKYGFHPARSYLLVYAGKRYDSKAIIGAAHGYLPGRHPAPAGRFSGGEARIGPLLRKLGFTLQVGDDLTPERLEDLLAKLNVNRPHAIPALYQPITLLWAFSRARRGEPRLVSWAETQYQVKALLNNYGRDREGDRVFYPIAALHRVGLWELDIDPEQVPSAHGSSVPQRWFEENKPNGGLVQPVYDLLRESPEGLDAAVQVLVQTYFTEADDNAAMLLSELGLSEPGLRSPMEAASFTARAAEYQRLCGRADIYWRDRDTKRATRTSSTPIRSKDARDAVRLRSEGHCENPHCTGDIKDRTDEGQAILEIDHIHDLALGGDDDPEQMIALCPNCHATKTRGSKRAALKPILLAAAKSRHDRLANGA